MVRRRRKRPIRDMARSLENAGYLASDTARLAKAVLRELTDGVHLTIVKKKRSWKEFFFGQGTELPLEIRVDLLEEDER